MAEAAEGNLTKQELFEGFLRTCDNDSDSIDSVIIKIPPTYREDATLEERFGHLEVFKKPQELISTVNNKLEINDSVIKEISMIDVHLHVVAVCGLYRTGKSYLMNTLANQKKRFVVGSNVSSQTKGIWAFCVPHPLPDCKNEVLLLLDTEGLSDPVKGDADHDNRLFCFTILLSSVMIYNNQGVFNQDSLEKLSFVTAMAKNIKMSNDKDITDDENSENLRILTPVFIMCLRDFFLKMQHGDRKFESADEYFESVLEISGIPGKESNDEIRNSIGKYFSKRKCFAIRQPAMNEALEELEDLPEDEIAKGFTADMQKMKEFIYSCKPKVLDAVTKKYTDGLVFESFARTYIDGLSEGSSMTFDSAYRQASKYHNSRLLATLIGDYYLEVDSVNIPVKKQDLQDKFLELQRNTITKFRQQAYPSKREEFENKALGLMEDRQKKKMLENKEKTQQFLLDKLTRLHKKVILTKSTKGEYDDKNGLTMYKKDLENIQKKFLEDTEEHDPDEQQSAFMTYKKNTKEEKFEVEYQAKRREDEERMDILRKEVDEQLKKRLEEKLEDMKQEKERFLKEEREKMEKNYEKIAYEKLKKKSFMDKIWLLFSS